MHSGAAFGTWQVIYQKQDVECFRRPRNFCTLFRTWPGAAVPSTSTAKLPLPRLASQTFALALRGQISHDQNFALRESAFFGASTSANLYARSCVPNDCGQRRHGSEFSGCWQCSNKNVSSPNVGEAKESRGFGVQTKKSKRVTRSRKSGIQNGASAKHIEKKTRVRERQGNNETDSNGVTKGTEELSTVDHSDLCITRSSERNRTESMPKTEESVRKERADTQNAAYETGGFVEASMSDPSGEMCDAGLPPGENDSFGRALLCSRTARERRNVLKRLKLAQIVPDTEELNDVLSTLCRQRRFGCAHELMDVVNSMPSPARLMLVRNVKTYTIMIDICGKSRQLPKAFFLFYRMQQEGLFPNTITYNAVVAACSRNNEPDLAFEVFKEMEEAGLTPDKFTYGALIDSCAKCGNVDRAFEIADIMDRRKIQKDQTIYSALIDACGRANQVDRAFSVYEDMKKCGVWPNLITFSVLIDTCANAREPEKAFELFSEVKHWGFPTANVVVYTALIDACAKAGWQDQAQQVLEAMLRDNVQPNEITYGALIDGWSRAGHLDEAFACLHEMIYQQRVTPNAVLLGGLAETARRRRECHRAKQLWEIMMRLNIRISRLFYPSLMAMAAQNGDVDAAVGIAFHVFGNGFLRRCSTRSDDPCLRAMADALIFVRSKINHTSDAETRAVREARMKASYDATAMSVEEMDSVDPSKAYQRCISWGDLEEHRSNSSLKRRTDRVENSRAKQARDAGLRALRELRCSHEDRNE